MKIPEIVVKYDYQLTKKEKNQIFRVYNECFYDNKINGTKKIDQVIQWLGDFHIFQWYLIKVDNTIVGIANFVYDTTNVDKFMIKPQYGENISSIGVLEKHRRKGYARMLVNKIVEDHGDGDLVVELKKANPNYTGLLLFYKSIGFDDIKEVGSEDVYLRRKIE